MSKFAATAAAEERETEKIMAGLSRVLGGKPIDLVAPALVVAVARALYVEADSDPEKLSFLMFKFIGHLGETVSQMADDEGLGEPRQ
jgi:hypothetical protein